MITFTFGCFLTICSHASIPEVPGRRISMTTTSGLKASVFSIASRAELTVAKDQNVRLASGWFSERSACYLAAGRPVVTQDTGFGRVLPTGEGLFAFTTSEEAAEAMRMIESDYPRHSRAARAIAEEHFRAETVLARVLEQLGAA